MDGTCPAWHAADRFRSVAPRRTRSLLPVVALAPFAEPHSRLDSFGLLRKPVDRPRKPPCPVRRIDGCRLIDAIAPAKHVLNRQDQQIAARCIEQLDQRCRGQPRGGRASRARDGGRAAQAASAMKGWRAPLRVHPPGPQPTRWPSVQCRACRRWRSTGRDSRPDRETAVPRDRHRRSHRNTL